MISETGRRYFQAMQNYNRLDNGRKRLFLTGTGLLLLQDCKSEAVKKALLKLISSECFLLGVADKSLAMLQRT